MTPRFAFLSSILCVLTACSDDPAQVADFDLKTQDQRRYQIISNTEVVSSEQDGERYTERMSYTELRSYRVTDSDSNMVRVAVQPDYLHAQADSGYAFGSVIGAMNDNDRQLLNTLALGSTFAVGLNDGQILNSPDNSYMSARRDLMGRLNQVQALLTQPGLVSGMQLQAGESRTITSDSGSGFADFTLRVNAVQGDNVLLTLESDSGSRQAYGRMVVERETGWSKRVGLVVKSEFTEDSKTYQVRSTIVVAPAQWPHAELLRYSSLQDLDIDFTHLRDNLEHLVEATPEQVFADSTGQVSVNGDRLEIEYQHPVNEAEELGQFNFKHIQAFDQHGDLLALDFQAQSRFSYPTQDGTVITHAEVFPLGWGDIESSLARIHRVEATVQWFPQKLQLVPIDVPKQGATELTHGDARARLQTTDNPRAFDLYLYPTPHQLFGVQVYGGEQGVLHSAAIDGGADWLNDEERYMLNVIQYGEFPTRIRLTFRAQVPEQLRLVTYSIEQAPAAERTLQFELR